MKNIRNRHNKTLKIGIIATLAFILLLAVFFIYTGSYYHAEEKALDAISSSASVTVTENKDDYIVFMPEEPTAGLIFYPGGKVEYKAYSPLMKACADKGIMCILVKMPFNLAVFDIDRADDVKSLYPDIDNWYIAGHSLGGAMASGYISENSEGFDGIILLGSYSTKDLKDTNIKALLVYGSEDHVLSMEAYNENKVNLPSDYEEHIIQGGCHSYFGSYGLQKGDGNPTVSPEEQLEVTTDLIINFTKGVEK